MKKTLLILSLIFFSSNVLAANKTEDEVAKFISDIGNKIVNIANNSGSEKEKRDKIIRIVDDNIDSKWIARFVLSKHYRRSSLEQRKKFSDLYHQFMINTYGPKFKNYNGRKFTVSEVSKRRSFYLAKAEFLPRESNIPILIDFRVKEKNGRLVILDFIAEGISLIETQRSEFNSAISQNGMDKFLEILNKRVKRLEVNLNS